MASQIIMDNFCDPTHTQKLYQAWHQAIAEQKLINQFEAPDDDPEERWVKGDAIAFGLKQDGEAHIFYAENRTRNQAIHGVVEEKYIDSINVQCQFNGFRALRPGGHRRPIGRQPDISGEPDACRFFCQDHSQPLSLLARTPLLQLRLKHFTWNAYYNAAPIEPDGHFLWVPSLLDHPSIVLPHFPQQLTWPLLDDGIRLFQCFKQTMVFFNSLHAGASVNHIHFQAIYHKHILAAETCPLIQKEDYALLDGYLAPGIVFMRDTESAVVFEWVDRLQRHHIPFNLILVGKRIILIPRNIDHEIVSEFPGNGLAALGMCGRIITVDRMAYLNANAERVQKAFHKMTLTVPHMEMLDS